MKVAPARKYPKAMRAAILRAALYIIIQAQSSNKKTNGGMRGHREFQLVFRTHFQCMVVIITGNYITTSDTSFQHR